MTNLAPLRIIACGGADDGTSALSTRLLDGSTNGREPGIPPDAAYRPIPASRRSFIVADVPGPEPYTHRIVAGASAADVAIVLVDARKGLSTQIRKRSYILALLRVPQVVLAVNKMDLVDYSFSVFSAIESEYREFGRRIQLSDPVCIPISALQGDNVIEAGVHTAWYRGPTLIEHLERITVDDHLQAKPFRMLLQSAAAPDVARREYAGTIASGTIKRGDRVQLQPSGPESRVMRIVGVDGELPRAVAGQSISLTLDGDVDIDQGGVLSGADDPVPVADQFEASVIWIDDAPLLRGRSYLMRIGTQAANATIAPIKYKINVDTLEHVAADKLELNDIGVCDLELDREVAFEPHTANRELGAFVLVDGAADNPVGAGQIRFALRRSRNISWQTFDVAKTERAMLKGQRACVLWLTGLSGAGKSAVANLVEKRLHARGRHTYLLDGDNVRKGLNKDLGFTEADRVENIRRVAQVAALMVDAGLIVIAAFISPFRSEREMARALLAPDEFLEVFVDTPLEVAEQRDPKGLYAKARRGQLKNFTGIDSPYERPTNPEITIDGAGTDPEVSADRIVLELQRRGIVRD